MGRSIIVSSATRRLFVKNRQLVAVPRDNGPNKTLPCEDLDLVLIDDVQSVHLDSHTLSTLASTGAVLVVTDDRHYPAGIWIPYAATQDHGATLEAQFNLSKPRRKQAWQHIVTAKIRAQAVNLADADPAKKTLERMANKVRSGDIGNLEAVAARTYWNNMLGPGFTRQRHTRKGPNGLLDYGYAILRAALARSIALAGLHPAIGMQHSNLTNPFSLSAMTSASRSEQSSMPKSAASAQTAPILPNPNTVGPWSRHFTSPWTTTVAPVR